MSTLFISHNSSDNAAAADLADRLEKQHHRSIFLDFKPGKGIVAGHSWEQTLYRKLRACRAVIALITDDYLASHWCFAEIALARMEGKPVFALKMEGLRDRAKLPSILKEKQYIDLRRKGEEGYQSLWQGLEQMHLLGVPGDWDPNDPPYLGLSAFQERHAALFFGRGEEIRQGLEKLERGAPGLIMVLGASGSGKSSLVRAGIVPRLRREEDRWLVVDPFRPGRDPFRGLAEKLAEAFPQEARGEWGLGRILRKLGVHVTPDRRAETDAEPPRGALPLDDADTRVAQLLDQIEELRKRPPEGAAPPFTDFLDWTLSDLRRICGGEAPEASPASPEPAPEEAAGPDRPPLVEIAEELLRLSGRDQARVLLIIDQFEELLDGEETGPAAGRFLSTLREALEIEHSPLMALGTLRSDFLPLFQHNRTLAELDSESLSVGAMSPADMRRVIEEPARLGAIELEEGLTDRLLADTGTPDALPLLSFALRKLWQERDKKSGKLLLATYRELNGLAGAVAREAEAEAAAALRTGHEAELRRAFLDMARRTEDGTWARQPVSWEELPETIHPTLERFVERRLLVSRGDSVTSTVEVAHEALFRSWKRLARWLQDHSGELLLRQQIQRDAKIWEESSFATDNLWRGGRLQQAAELLKSGRLGESGNARILAVRFVRAGLKRRLLRRLSWSGLAALIILGLSVGLYITTKAKNEAERQTRIANSGRLAAASQTERPGLAALLAIEAFEVADTFEARNSLFLALQSHPRLETYLHQGELHHFRVALDGTVVSVDKHGAVQRWRLGELGATPVGEPLQLPFSLDDELILDAGPQGTVFLAGEDDSGEWTAGLWRLGESGTEHLGELPVLAFGPDGLVASVEPEGLQLWRLGEAGATKFGRPLEPLEPLDDAEGCLEGLGAQFAFGPDRILASYGSSDGKIQLWRLGDSDATKFLELGGREETPGSYMRYEAVCSVAFGPNGILAAANHDGTVQLWRLEESGATRFGGPRPIGAKSLAFSPDGLLASGHDRHVELWRLEESGEMRREEPFGESLLPIDDGEVTGVVFRPDGTLVSSHQRVGSSSLRVWRLGESGARPLGQLLGPWEPGSWGPGVTFGPNGTLASSDVAGLQLWRLGALAATKVGGPLPGFQEKVSFGPDGVFALGRQLWRLGESGATKVGEPFNAASGVFGPDGTLAIRGGDYKTEQLWRLDESGAELTKVGEPFNSGGGVFGPDGLLAIPGEDRKVQLWKLDESGAKKLGEPFDLGGEEAKIVFGPHGILAILEPEDSKVQLWRLGDSGATKFGEPLDNALRIAFGPDGTLALGQYHGGVKLFKFGESGTKEFSAPLEGPVASVAFSPDGTLAAGDEDGKVWLWRLDGSGATQVGQPLQGDGFVGGLAFGPDGTLAAADRDVRLWHVSTPSLRAAACRLAGRNFSLTEWRRYLGADEPYRCTCPDQGPGLSVTAEHLAADSRCSTL